MLSEILQYLPLLELLRTEDQWSSQIMYSPCEKGMTPVRALIWAASYILCALSHMPFCSYDSAALVSTNWHRLRQVP